MGCDLSRTCWSAIDFYAEDFSCYLEKGCCARENYLSRERSVAEENGNSVSDKKI